MFEFTPPPSSTACSSPSVFFGLWLYYDRRDHVRFDRGAAQGRPSTASAATSSTPPRRAPSPPLPAVRPRERAAEVLSSARGRARTRRRGHSLLLRLTFFHNPHMPQTIAVLDFGSQYTQVIARRIRECQVYSKIYHFSTPAETLRADGVIGIILSGGPSSVFARERADAGPGIFELGRAGARHLLRHPAHGPPAGRQGRRGASAANTATGRSRSSGRGRLFAGLPRQAPRLEFARRQADQAAAGIHGHRQDRELALRRHRGPRAAASTAIQFHPEVFHTERGHRGHPQLPRRRLPRAARTGRRRTSSRTPCRRSAPPSASPASSSASPAASTPRWPRRSSTGRSAASSPASSSTTACCARASARPCRALYKRHFKIDLRVVDASALFLRTPARASTSPRGSARSSARPSSRCSRSRCKKIGHADFLAQGTLYPDVIESVAIGDNPGRAHQEPPQRRRPAGAHEAQAARAAEGALQGRGARGSAPRLGLPREVVWRQPFPGPGLGVRVRGPDHARPARDPARGRRHPAGGDDGQRLVLEGLAVVLRLPAREVGRRGGRRAQLCLCDRRCASWRASTR